MHQQDQLLVAVGAKSARYALGMPQSEPSDGADIGHTPVTRPAKQAFMTSQHLKSSIRSLAFIICDLVGAVVASAVPALIVAGAPGALVDQFMAAPAWDGIAWHAWGVALLTAVMFAHLVGRGHYRQRITFWSQALDITSASVLSLGCDLVMTLFIYHEPLSVVSFLRWTLLPVMMLGGRITVRRILSDAGLWQIRVLVFGKEAERDRVRALVSSDPAMGYALVGTIDPGSVAMLRQPNDWYRLMIDRRADMVAVVGTGGSDTDMLSALSLTDIPVMAIPDCGPMAVVGVQPHYLPGQDAILLSYQPRLIEPVARLLKTVMDYALAAFLCVFFFPLFLAIAVAIRSDGGPAIYRHRRIGAGGRAFLCLKFRSMRTNSDEILAELLENDPVAAREWATTRKLTNDPRITRVGRLLRLTSLDELPQLFNVLRGEMSLVGPRPIVQAEVEFYGRYFGFYTHMKPGLTGLWQASGRSKTTYSHRVQLDVWYARNWSLWQDIAILLMTIPAVLLRKGAM